MVRTKRKGWSGLHGAKGLGIDAEILSFKERLRADSLSEGKPQNQRSSKISHLYNRYLFAMSTAIHVSKKLEKLIKKYITPTSSTETTGILGKWNATVFYIERRKNWLLYNSKTHYSVILENLAAKDLPNIREKISLELQLQLASDGMHPTQEQIDWLLDEIHFHPTDADRSTLGYMNQILFAIDCLYGSDLYPTLAQINAYLNDSVFSLDGASKYSNLSKPREEMEKILNSYLATDQTKPVNPSQLN